MCTLQPMTYLHVWCTRINVMYTDHNVGLLNINLLAFSRMCHAPSDLYVLCNVVLCQLIMNIVSIVCKRCTIVNVMSQTREFVRRRSRWTFPRSSRSQLSSHTRSHVPNLVPLHDPMNVPGVQMAFTYTFPRWILVKLHVFCNFGTPKSPKMLNIVLLCISSIYVYTSRIYILTYIYIFFYSILIKVCISIFYILWLYFLYFQTVSPIWTPSSIYFLKLTIRFHILYLWLVVVLYSLHPHMPKSHKL